MKGYRDLEVWQESMQFVTSLYRETEAFPKYELYGLTNQLRRSAVSVPSNIAEGYGRSSRKEFHQFLSHARGSLLEAETQVQIAGNLGYFSEKIIHELLQKTNQIGRMLNGLRSWCETDHRSS